MSQLIKTIFLIISVIQIVQSIDYCTLNCTYAGIKYNHTICERENVCEPTSNCWEIKLDDTWRNWILDSHNEFRSKVASGNDTRNGLSPAANMNLLKYDRNLEEVARCHINRCPYDIDFCRRTETFDYVGQNLYITPNGTVMKTQNDVRNVLRAWYNQYEKLASETIDNYNPIAKANITQFTQLMWAETTHVGCAISKNKDNQILMACNYGPGGNFLNLPVYSRGTPCTECGKGVGCSMKYPGLCGGTARVPTEPDSNPDGGGGGGGNKPGGSGSNSIRPINYYLLIQIVVIIALFFISLIY